MRTGATKHSDEFARTPAVITDGYHVAQWAFPVLGDAFEDIDKIVCSATAGENNDAARRRPRRGEWKR